MLNHSQIEAAVCVHGGERGGDEAGVFRNHNARIRQTFLGCRQGQSANQVCIVQYSWVHALGPLAIDGSRVSMTPANASGNNAAPIARRASFLVLSGSD